MSEVTPFYIKDCALVSIATGVKAHTLLDLREKLSTINPNCIYFHFWGGRLRATFEYREYHNDFSHWAHHSLHDDILSERLELLNPTEYDKMETLRNDLIEILDNRLDEKELIPWAKGDELFHFMRSNIVVFQTKHFIQKPEDLVNVVPLLSRSSIFYHFIDSSRRVPDRIDDFSVWLKNFEGKYQKLIDQFRKIDPYLISLAHLQEKLNKITAEYFL